VKGYDDMSMEIGVIFAPYDGLMEYYLVCSGR
jgi:hypothetical protein